MDWYIRRNDADDGPISTEDLAALSRTGKLRQEDLVRRDGMPTWHPASSIPGLWPSVASPVSATPQTLIEPEQVPAPMPSAPSTRSWNFILQHWRGQLPFVSYWIMGVALTLFVSASSYIIGRLDLPPRAGATVDIGFVTFVLLLTIWQLVGILLPAKRCRISPALTHLRLRYLLILSADNAYGVVECWIIRKRRAGNLILR